MLLVVNSCITPYADGDLLRAVSSGSAATADEFRPIRLSYGLYYQLDHTSRSQLIKAGPADC